MFNKIIILSIFLFPISFLGLAQTKNGIWFYPSKAQKINGYPIIQHSVGQLKHINNQ
jgi:NADH:ubiquinone oxidoreductase subunit K